MDANNMFGQLQGMIGDLKKPKDMNYDFEILADENDLRRFLDDLAEGIIIDTMFPWNEGILILFHDPYADAESADKKVEVLSDIIDKVKNVDKKK